jgi:hypothetical protein
MGDDAGTEPGSTIAALTGEGNKKRGGFGMAVVFPMVLNDSLSHETLLSQRSDGPGLLFLKESPKGHVLQGQAFHRSLLY